MNLLLKTKYHYNIVQGHHSTTIQRRHAMSPLKIYSQLLDSISRVVFVVPTTKVAQKVLSIRIGVYDVREQVLCYIVFFFLPHLWPTHFLIPCPYRVLSLHHRPSFYPDIFIHTNNEPHDLILCLILRSLFIYLFFLLNLL